MIAIPAFHQTETKSYSVTLPHGLITDLESYRQFYRTAYGADVKEADLIREIVRCFLDRDESFRAFKAGTRPRDRTRARNASTKSAGTSAPAGNST